MARGDQLARQWKIIQTLISSRNGKSVAVLAQDLQCHRRTVYRDLEALQVAGFPVYTERVAGKTRWSLLDTAKNSIPIPFSLPELMALYFSRGMMEALKNTHFYDSLVSLFDKIKMTLPGEYIEYLDRIENSLAVKSQPYKQYGRWRKMIDQVSEAVIDKKYIEIDYYTLSRQKKTRRNVAPYKIWFFDGTFYLIGYCDLREDIRIFAMDRIRNLKLTDEIFEPPDDFKVDEFMKSSFGVFHGEPVRIKIWFAGDIAEYIQEKIWHETQHIAAQKDGSIIFEAEVSGIDEIKFWILKWGAKARVLAPETLVKALEAEAKRMVANYSSPADLRKSRRDQQLL